jgi:HD-GYP domain-containing protein (c-di-GMP phosphodiesterase class II)
LIGHDIPLYSRIISVVDAYEAMTDYRPYRQGMSKEKAVNELIRCSGSQFEDKLAKILFEKVLSVDFDYCE